ncbi:hypothetical protein AUR66_19775 [Haloferax profundi]|uniref:Uncharacterized protein n=1 Tax=Haloferax profundi TaxID=1544718 RepID=A0A0W1REY9_9EURY|nr:hypothetical protein AUR66_19775 [Haloferax profundi]
MPRSSQDKCSVHLRSRDVFCEDRPWVSIGSLYKSTHTLCCIVCQTSKEYPDFVDENSFSGRNDFLGKRFEIQIGNE